MLTKTLMTVAALALFASDATAGPILQRLRDRRANHCGATCTPSYAPAPVTSGAHYTAPSAPTVVQAGCVGGRCPIR